MNSPDKTTRAIVRAAAFIEASAAIERAATIYKDKSIRLALKAAADQVRQMAIKTRASAEGPADSQSDPVTDYGDKSHERWLEATRRGGPTVSEPDRPHCKPDQSCCDFTCGN